MPSTGVTCPGSFNRAFHFTLAPYFRSINSTVTIQQLRPGNLTTVPQLTLISEVSYLSHYSVSQVEIDTCEISKFTPHYISQKVLMKSYNYREDDSAPAGTDLHLIVPFALSDTSYSFRT